MMELDVAPRGRPSSSLINFYSDLVTVPSSYIMNTSKFLSKLQLRRQQSCRAFSNGPSCQQNGNQSSGMPSIGVIASLLLTS